MLGEVARLRRYPFLPPDARLTEVPTSTPLIRSNRAYAAAYRTVLNHFRAYRVRLDGGNLLVRGKSLPVLYEWWCALELVRILRGCLRPCGGQPQGRGSPFRRVGGDRPAFVVEFEADQAVDFEDEAGRLVRLRYVPAYRTEGASTGRLTACSARTANGRRTWPSKSSRPRTATPTPRKRSSCSTPSTPPTRTGGSSKRSGSSTANSACSRRGRCCRVRCGRWCRGRRTGRCCGPEWSASCTVDNVGFWSEAYDVTSSTAGTIQARPRPDGGPVALDGLVRLLLKRAGVRVRLS